MPTSVTLEEVLKEDFDRFMGCLKEAGVEMEHHYFQIAVAGSGELILRERVYCYELYHQLRNALGDDFPYQLVGELDKKGHPIIRSATPDFVVHVPGNMNRNLVAIEVKPLTVKRRIGKLREDIKKLKEAFLGEGRYYRAVMLLYGDGKRDLSEEIVRKMEGFAGNCGGRLLMIWHRGPGERPERVGGR